MASNTQSRYKVGYSKAVLGAFERRTAAADATHLLPHLRTDSKILDLGCGPGSITLDLAKLATGGSVVAVDISAESIAVARQRVDEHRMQHAAQKLGSVTFQEVDILEGLPFADGAFDVVYSGQVFIHLLAGDDGKDRATAAMREVYRVLRPGGVVATKDVSAYHWFPRSYTEGREGEALLILRKLVFGSAVPPGAEVPGVVGAAGFDPARMTISASTRVASGREAKAWFGKMILSRLAETETREKLPSDGITVEDLAEAKAAMKAWLEDDLAWQVGLHTEVLAFK